MGELCYVLNYVNIWVPWRLLSPHFVCSPRPREGVTLKRTVMYVAVWSDNITPWSHYCGTLLEALSN